MSICGALAKSAALAAIIVLTAALCGCAADSLGGQSLRPSIENASENAPSQASPSPLPSAFEAEPSPAAPAPFASASASQSAPQRPKAASAEPYASPTNGPLASEYLPFEDIFLHYYDKVSQREIECAIEFFSAETGLVQRHFTGEGVGRIEVSQYFGGALMRNYQLTDVSYFQNFTPLSPSDERETLIAEPLVIGRGWVVPPGTAGIVESREVPAGIRRITALNKRAAFEGFGQFSVLEVETIYENGFRLIQQYMRNVGLVAQLFTDSAGVTLEHLVVSAREKGRMITQPVRLYFVHAKERRLYYIDRELTLNTNASLSAHIADELRNVPAGSGLLPLSSDVSIVTMYPFLDRSENRVILRFSEEFATHMPADEYTRLLLHHAIANTLCGYYGYATLELLGWPNPRQTTRYAPVQGALPWVGWGDA